ncbi:hypothetical protein L9F63_014377 [Diploptera punctata]|uniref:LRRNT domain-containing protein n=1 Tax=Diploptera punctata TaxID=6984 RepID=A0AAD8A829_DIPPU|nr:hypothetical protein L9F63_014377 [Diploptera punctata]
MKSAIGLLSLLLTLQIGKCACPVDCECDGSSITCSSVGLTEIPRNLPSNILESLDLSINGIIDVKVDSFFDLTVLRTLYLSYNEIKHIEVKAFAKLQKLREIDLSYNDLEFIHSEMFSRNPELEVVSVSGNPLAHLPVNMPFLKSSSIRALDMSLCSINMIYPATFSRLPNLHILDLKKNLLQKLDPCTLNVLKNLTIVELDNNRWSCSCEIQKIIQWVNSLRNNVPAHKPVKCFENGQYRTLWSVADPHQLCINNIEQYAYTPKIEQTILEKSTVKLEVTTRSSQINKARDDIFKNTEDNLNAAFSLNSDTVVMLIVLAVMLAVSVFITVILVNYCTYRMNNTTKKQVENVYVASNTGHIYQRINTGKPRTVYSKQNLI